MAKWMRAGGMICALVLATGCTSPTPGILKTTMPDSSRERFTYCTGYGCTQRWTVNIRDDEWADVKALFATPASSAEEERAIIAQAIGTIEDIIGPKAKTSNDEAGATVLSFKSTRGQLDCIDESHNTTMFLHFMQRDGLFKFHRVGPVAHRGRIIDRWFHNTAVVIENDTSDSYVIDSWFGLNGDPADVVPLEAWEDGWHPEGFINGATRVEVEAARRARKLQE